MTVFPKLARVCISHEEAMTAAAIVWRAAQEQRQLQQYMLGLGSVTIAETCEAEFMRLIGISNKLADSTRVEVSDDVG